MKKVFRKTLTEARQEVDEWVEIFRQNGVYLRILDIKVIPDTIYEEGEDEEYDGYDEYECCYDEDEDEDETSFMSALRKGKYYNFEQYHADLDVAGSYGYGFLVDSECYIRSLSDVGLAKKLLALKTWANNLSGIVVTWKLSIDRIPSYGILVPDSEDDLRLIIRDYASNLSEEYLDAIRKEVKNKISEWEYYLSRIA